MGGFPRLFDLVRKLLRCFDGAKQANKGLKAS